MHQVVTNTYILEANEQMADHNREHFKERGVYVVNLMSAPGAGKTSVLEETIRRLKNEYSVDDLDLLFIENVGNLVCPAEFYLGENLRVMVYSVVEGADKPKKYPIMFHESEAVLLNKIDLLPYSGVSLEALRRNVLEVSPETVIFPVSCRTGEGVEVWIDWLRQRVASSRARGAE